MKLEIYKKFMQSNKKIRQFIVNDRYEENSKIMFANQLLNSNNRVDTETAFFMDIDEAYHFAFLILNNRIGFEKPFEQVRGKNGIARSIQMTRKNHEDFGEFFYLKIDEGTGSTKDNGYTTFQKREKSINIPLTLKEAELFALNIQRRIMVRETVSVFNLKANS